VTSSLESLSVDPPLPTVLIVDDVEANLVALRALLEGTGCNVTSASSGNQALRLLLRHEFAVMLLDVQMPEMDGYEVARHARMIPATRDIPIIFLPTSCAARCAYSSSCTRAVASSPTPT
jgi:CheY-like chemotaxis protein